MLDRACILRLLSDDRLWLEPVAVAHPTPNAVPALEAMVAAERHPLNEGLIGEVAHSGRSLRLTALAPGQIRSTFTPAFQAYIGTFGVRSILIVPLRAEGEMLGTLLLAGEVARAPFTQDDALWLDELADQAALAIVRARLFAAAE